MNSGVELKYHLCVDDPAPGPVTFLILQLFNLTLQHCKINQFHDQLELNELSEKFDNATKYWQKLVSSKIEDGSQTTLNNITSYFHEYIKEISTLKFELQKEITNCINTKNTQKETDFQKWQQHIWKFTSKETAVS